MHQAWIVVFALIALLLVNSVWSNPAGANDAFNEFFSDPLYGVLFGLLGTGAFIAYSENRHKSYGLAELAGAFLAGFFLIRFAIDWIV